MKEAMFYQKKGNIFECQLCPHRCHLKEGETGICGTRKVVDHTMYAMNYGLLTATNIDPIEKKPLLCFMPGSHTFSIGSFGCNFHCSFCQNYDISKEWDIKSTKIYTPKDVIRETIEHKLPSISYTYNEPTVFYEFVYNTAMLASSNGLKNILVTNGYINKEPLEALAPYIDAANIDFKSYDDYLYKKVCGGTTKTIFNTIETLKDKHLEITFLIVPGLNDDLNRLKLVFEKLAIIKSDLVIHITRYFPRYHMTEPATNIKHMLDIQNVAKNYFTTVILGNV